MKRKHYISILSIVLLLAVIGVIVFISYKNSHKLQPVEDIPVPPDYADTTQWYITQRDAPVDIFYIISTETGDYTLHNLPCHYADTRNDSIRQLLHGEMVGVDHILSGNFNFFSPYYRQCTLQSFTSDSLVLARTPLAMADVQKSFAYYLAHYNQGRPFILAGFSQGAMAVVELLKQMDSATFSRMVAAYVIGWKVTDEDLAKSSNFHPAHDSVDFGVTICYNSVRDSNCAIPMLSHGNRIAINPVNWHTDTTPATLVSPISSDTVTVAFDTATLLLNVSGYSGTDYITPLIGREGNYHSLEISLYRHCLRRNMALRSQTYLENPR